MISGMSFIAKTRHRSSRLCLWLDVLLLVACIGIVFTGFRLHSTRAEKLRLEIQVPGHTQSRAEIITSQALHRYRLPSDSNILDIFNDKLTETGLLYAVMDITPGAPIEQHNITSRPVRVRLTPVPGQRLASLLNVIEHQTPRFMIVSLQMTRIRSGDTAMDITMDLLMFQQD